MEGTATGNSGSVERGNRVPRRKVRRGTDSANSGRHSDYEMKGASRERGLMTPLSLIA